MSWVEKKRKINNRGGTIILDSRVDDSNDPDKNVYNNIQAVDTQYYLTSELLSLSGKLRINSENFSMIHLNIRSAKKSFEKLKDFLSQTSSFFKILCLTETSFNDRNSGRSLYQLTQYTAIHQHRSPSHKSGQGGGISMYIHDSLNFKSQRKLDINAKNAESLSIELISKHSKNTVLSTIYRPPDGDFKAFNTFLKDVYSISLKSNKLFYAAGDFHLNLLDYNKNGKVTKFLNLTCACYFVPFINKPTRVTKTSATAIDHIITISLLHRTINTRVLKLDISDHFPIFFIAKTAKKMTPEGKVQITKRLINSKTKETFKNALPEMTWDNVIGFKQTDSAYEAFLNKFTSPYDKITEKSKTLKNPWIITNGILKSSKTKQRLYDKFLKSKTFEHEISYKNYSKLFELIKRRAKSQYYSKMIFITKIT